MTAKEQDPAQFSSEFIPMDDIDASNEFSTVISHSRRPITWGSPIRLLPLQNQSSQVITIDAENASSMQSVLPSSYLAIGSSENNGTTKYTLVRKPRRYRVRPPPTQPFSRPTLAQKYRRAWSHILPAQGAPVDEVEEDTRFALRVRKHKRQRQT